MDEINETELNQRVTIVTFVIFVDLLSLRGRRHPLGRRDPVGGCCTQNAIKFVVGEVWFLRKEQSVSKHLLTT